MKISIISSSSSRNSIGRAFVLAEVLKRRYKVEIIAPDFGSGIWEPLKEHLTALKLCKGYMLPKFVTFTLPQMLKAISGDIIYAIKPFPSSFGVALFERYSKKRPLLLDIDDYEIAGYFEKPIFKSLKKIVQSVRSPNGFFPLVITYQLVHLADEITVSSSYLQNKFGGTIVVHGRDTSFFDPQRYDRDAIRERLGLHKKEILFLGTPRPHKGLEDLIDAVVRLNCEEVEVLIVGADYSDSYTDILKKKGNTYVRVLGMQLFNKIPEFLASADIVCVPQRLSLFSLAQVPAKIFDAMAMAKPIISTNVSDIPLILSNGCGMIVGPNNPKQLAEKIEYLLKNENVAIEMGKRAREKCIKEYSYDKMEEILKGVFSKYQP